MGCFVDATGSGNAFLNGAYSQVGWFLTGEHRPYDRKAGAIDRGLSARFPDDRLKALPKLLFSATTLADLGL